MSNPSIKNARVRARLAVRALETDGDLHVMPEGDLREHIYQNCWCHPAEVEPGLIVHNSMDRREEFEEGRKMS